MKKSTKKIMERLVSIELALQPLWGGHMKDVIANIHRTSQDTNFALGKVCQAKSQTIAIEGKILALEKRLDQVLTSQNQLIIAVNKLALKK